MVFKNRFWSGGGFCYTSAGILLSLVPSGGPPEAPREPSRARPSPFGTAFGAPNVIIIMILASHPPETHIKPMFFNEKCPRGGSRGTIDLKRLVLYAFWVHHRQIHSKNNVFATFWGLKTASRRRPWTPLWGTLGGPKT